MRLATLCRGTAFLLLILPFVLTMTQASAAVVSTLARVSPAVAGDGFLLAGSSRYSGRSGGSRSLAPMSRGLSNSQFKGGYGFTNKSTFRNSENNRSQFRNGFSDRSYFGNRYDRSSKLKPLYNDRGGTPPARELIDTPKLSIQQPTARYGPSAVPGQPPVSAGSAGPARTSYPGFAAQLRAKEAARRGGPELPYRGIYNDRR